MAKTYVKFQTPKEIADKLISIVSIAKDTGKLRRGANEATKSIEGGKAQIVVISEDVDPEEIVMHLPILCEEKGIPLAYVPSKADLGKAAGLSVGCAALAIESGGGAKEALDEVVARIGKPKKEKETPKPEATEKKEATPKKERPPKKKE